MEVEGHLLTLNASIQVLTRTPWTRKGVYLPKEPKKRKKCDDHPIWSVHHLGPRMPRHGLDAPKLSALRATPGLPLNDTLLNQNRSKNLGLLT